jgi:hypothetical protein
MRAAAVLALLPVLPLWLQPPAVERLVPYGGQRGTDVVVTFHGQRLGAPQGVLLLATGLQVVGVEGDGEERCRATLRIPADCPLGAHPLRLWTDRGVANVMLFQVGTLPEVQEQRSGDAPQRLASGTTVTGELRSEETDCYEVELAAGERLCCEVVAMRLGRGPIDTALAVYGPDGAEVAAADDTAHGLKDPWLSFRAAKAGVHRIAVSAAFADEANQGPYRLHVGAFPRPTMALPCGGAPGETLQLSLRGDGEPLTASVTLPDAVPDDGFYRYFPADAAGTAPTPLLLRVGGPANAEPRTDDQGRVTVGFPGAVHGVVEAPGATVRWFFHADQGTELEFRALARVLRSPLDPVLIARAADGRFLAYDDDGGNSGDARLRFSAPATGDYSIEVAGLLRTGSAAHVFRLEGVPVGDSLRTRMVVGRGEDAALTVPRGGATGGVLQVDNADAADGLQFALGELPAGVAAVFGPVRAGSNLGPFQLLADAEAAAACGLAALQLAAGREPQVRDPRFSQNLPLVTARNGQPLLGFVVKRLPVAVGAPAPIAVAADPPPAPLLRSGPLGVRVRIERRAGFDGPVALRALWLPSGVGGGAATIAPGGTDAVLPLDASDSAALGEFPFAVIATGGDRNDPFTIASPFVTVTVDKPWITASARTLRARAGTTAELELALRPAREPAPPCRLRLLSLPRGVSADPVELAPGATTAAVALRIAGDAPPGRHRGYRIEVAVPVGDGEVMARFAGGLLRIEPPAAAAGPGGEELR